MSYLLVGGIGRGKIMIIAGTGHRQQFCPCGFKENHPWLLDLKFSLIVELVAKEVTVV